MRQLRAWFSRLGGLFGKERREREFSAEMESHLRLHIEDNLRAGMSPADARREALLKLGGIEQTKQNYRERRGLPFLETFLRDIRFTARSLRKNPGFTFIVVVTLALGIGASAAIFSVLESQLWRPLPFPDSEKLVDVHVVVRENHRQWDDLAGPVYAAWQEQNHSFSSIGAYNYPEARNLTAGSTSERVTVMPVTPSLFGTLGIPVERGRGFLTVEATVGREHVAVLSDSIWRTHFSADPAILGKSVTIDGELYAIVGIASPRLRFEYVSDPSIYVPLETDSAATTLRNTYVIGRLAPGSTMDQARAELDGILQRQSFADGAKHEDAAAISNLRETWTSYAGRTLYFFAGAVLLVLLIACVNTAGLLLARGFARRREFSLRAALGAGRSTLIRQSLVESGALSLAGGIGGTLCGLWGADAFVAFIPAETLPRTTPISLDWRVLLFVLAISLITALLTGIAPALFASRTDVNDVLRQGGSGMSAARSQQKARNLLIAAEVSLAVVLLFGAGLFLSSFVRLAEAPRGFDAPGATSFRVALRGEHYSQPDQQVRYFGSLTDQFESHAGMEAVTFGSGIPLDGHAPFESVNVSGKPPHGKHGYALLTYSVASNYFDVLHMHLLAGRSFQSTDSESSPRVAILNRNAARTIFGTESPLGKVLDFLPDERRGERVEGPVQIVGVAENAQVFGANEVPFDVLYIPFAQHPVPAADLVVSARLPRAAQLAMIRDATYALDKDQPPFDIQTMDDLIDGSLSGAKFDLLLVASLAIVAIALVSIGMFGTVAYFVEQRTQEFGIRRALGATPSLILRHAVGRAMLTGLIGVCAGVAASLALGRVLRSVLYLVPGERAGMLYGVKINDPLSMLLACVLLGVVLFLASCLPARRAMRVDPMVALRYE